jgi:hypothetical protein
LPGLQLGRRLVTGGSYLVESIIGASLVQANAQLLADMLVELPATTAASGMRSGNAADAGRRTEPVPCDAG